MSKNLNRIRRAALMGTTATLAASFALAAGVATASAQDNQAADVEEVVVTGSRIKNANISSPSPVTTVGAEQIAIRGTTQIEDMLAVLPQTVAAQGDGDFAGDGTAQVDLRGLGPNRTLVLVDGHRLPYGQANQAAADLNSIPSALVSRVEVLTGGASAVYGADAVAGVVNFIMNRDFEGLQVSGQMSINQANNDSERYAGILSSLNQAPPPAIFDGFTYSTDITMGINSDDGKGNVTVAFSYRNANEILQKNRDYGACAFGGGSPEYTCGGSSNTFPAKIFDGNQYTGDANARVAAEEAARLLANPTNPIALTAAEIATLKGPNNSYSLLAYQKDGGGTRDFNGSTDLFNYAITQRTRAPSERFAITAFSHYAISDTAELYLDMNYTSNTSIGQIGPSANFGVTTELNCDNPYFSAEMLEQICTLNGAGGDDVVFSRVARRNVEGGGRQYWNSNDTMRVSGGIRGDLGDAWSYDVHGQFSRVKSNLIFQNGLDRGRMGKALLIATDVDGNIRCKSDIDGTDTKCVPWNVFQAGGVTQEALDYITVPQLTIGIVNQKVLLATITGDLTDYGFVLPGASTGVQFVGGIEHRSDQLTQYNDQIQVDNSTTGLPPSRTDIVTVSEFFSELAIPILEGHSMAEELTATAAFRWSDYSTTGPSSTWALGLTWSPNSDIRFRGQLQQAVRAPNLFELYNRVTNGLFDLADPDGNNIFDPCASDPGSDEVNQHTPQYTAAQCALQGVTQAQYDAGVNDQPAGQFNQKLGGNPSLDVERSTTYTLGAVFTPASIPGLTLSADFYNIKVKDFIGTVPPGLALSKCSLEADPYYCDLINRDAGGGLYIDGETSWVVSTNLNTGSLHTKGVDVNLNYGFDLPEGFGTMSITNISNYLISYETEALPGETPFECAGFYSGNCIVPRSKFGSTTSATWTTDGGVSLTGTWRFIGGTTLFDSTNTDSQNYQLENISYFDLAVSLDVMEGVRMRAGVNNLLGQRPATTSSVPAGLGTGNTYPGLYDVDMRMAFIAFTADF